MGGSGVRTIRTEAAELLIGADRCVLEHQEPTIGTKIPAQQTDLDSVRTSAYGHKQTFAIASYGPLDGLEIVYSRCGRAIK